LRKAFLHHFDPLLGYCFCLERFVELASKCTHDVGATIASGLDFLLDVSCFHTLSKVAFDPANRYVILQGLSGAAGGFLQIVPLAIYYVKLFLLASTPRSVWGIKYGARSVAWGTLFPGITLITVICAWFLVLGSIRPADNFTALSYSIISPIINGLACATFFLFYMLYKYLFLWAYQQDLTTDTGGLFFPKAIQQTFVGMYLQLVCLAALFFLKQDENKSPAAIPEGALTVVLIVVTVSFCSYLSPCKSVTNEISVLYRSFSRASSKTLTVP